MTRGLADWQTGLTARLALSFMALASITNIIKYK